MGQLKSSRGWLREPGLCSWSGRGLSIEQSSMALRGPGIREPKCISWKSKMQRERGDQANSYKQDRVGAKGS